MVLALAVVMASVSTGAAALAQAGAATPRPVVVRPDGEENLQWAASVVELTPLRRQGAVTAKLFGTAGGDPAMNGLYTYLAFFQGSPDEGWTVFRLGDFLSYRVLAEASGRLTLEVRESVLNETTGDIGARTRRLLVSWKGGNGREPPTSVIVTGTR